MTKKQNRTSASEISSSTHIHVDLSEVSVMLDGNDVKQALKSSKLLEHGKLMNEDVIKSHKSKRHESSSTPPERKKTKLISHANNGHVKKTKLKMSNKIIDTSTSVPISDSTNTKASLQTVFDEFDHNIRRSSIPLHERSDLKFKHLYFIHESNPGGCLSVHCYQDDINRLSPSDHGEFVEEFLGLVFEEDQSGLPRHVLGVMHDSACHVPDLVEYMADEHPNMTVKKGMMGKSDVDTLKMDAFRQLVHSTYSAGTYRCGPLLQVSLVGARSEECGGYYPDVLDLLESNPIIKAMMPWGSRSYLEGMPRGKSDDGPILWSRPGEQVIPTVDLPKSPTKRKRGINELKNLMYLPRTGESREILIEDRTKCHADQVGDFLEKKATAAVGLLKAVHAGEKCRTNRIVKEVVCFDPANFDHLIQKLKLDLHEPPMTQCITWVDDARLNQLAREGVGFSSLRLRDNDVYFIPRKVIHQFRTISAVTSIAWHVRLKMYHHQQQQQQQQHQHQFLGDPKSKVENSSDTKVELKVSSHQTNKKYDKKKAKMAHRSSAQTVDIGLSSADNHQMSVDSTLLLNNVDQTMDLNSIS